MLVNFSNFFNLEKRAVFYVNFVLILFVIFSFMFKIDLIYFFYFNLIFTFILGSFFFKKSKELAKTLIVTNMFVLFYFSFPKFAEFFIYLFGDASYLAIMFYNIFIAYIFLYFSSFNKTFLGNMKKFNYKIFFSIILLALVMGNFFYLIKEPVPAVFSNIVENDGLFISIIITLINSFLIALSEQFIFSAFLFNSYNKLSSRIDAIFQTAIIFVMFHILRFYTIVTYYYETVGDRFIFYLSIYYIMLFLFMLISLYLYSFKGKKYEGNFIYPVTFHFITDFILILYFLLGF